MNNFIVVILFILIISIVWILILKLLNPKLSLKEATILFKKQIGEILYSLFKSETNKKRFIFDDYLVVEFKNIAKPFSNSNFEVNCYNRLINETPCIIISFITKKIYNDEEIQNICDLELLKFKKYLLTYNLFWDCFAYPVQNDIELYIFIYYAEFPEDLSKLYLQKKRLAKQSFVSENDFIVDEELERELSDVD